MGSKVYWNCLIGSMAEQISILHMEVNFQFDGIPLSVHFAPLCRLYPPKRECTPRTGGAPPKRFSIKTEYLFQTDRPPNRAACL